MSTIPDNYKTILTLAGVGAVIAVGKSLSASEPITLRLLTGRVIIGSALSTAASAVLAIYPNLPMEGVVGIGSALGILGVHFIEAAVKSKLGIRGPRERSE